MDPALVALQDAMLPQGLPVLPRVELAARCLLAASDAGSGGDWFDAIPLPDGRVVVVVGDVVGHGVEASVVMAELKAVFDERVREDGDIVAALELIDRRAGRLADARTTTVCACVLDPQTGELGYCTAGHPPPVVVTPDGRASYLPLSGGRPLGAEQSFSRGQHVLGEGDVLLLYSDGLVERPGSPAQNTVDLLRVAGQVLTGPATEETTVDRICREVLDVLTRVTGYSDDITVLAVQRAAAVVPLRLVLPAVTGSVPTVRAGLSDWLAHLRIGPVDEMALLHAVSELVANAVEHAYPVPRATDLVRIAGDLGPTGEVRLEVADDGRWRVPVEDVDRGRGLAMVRAYTDDFRVGQSASGTRAVVRHQVAHPVALLRGVSTGPVVDGELGLSVDGQDVLVTGIVDRAGAVLLRRTLDRASRGGTRLVSVDLSEVDLLSSAGVRVLVDASVDGEVRLVAAAGSAAQRALDLVHLPYRS
ncbi:SpoIIE family protein phosphatase [Nocardioides sp. SR21]|uniref:SpoIIE family protein phosphatase n=1 Tax=Nocardioides sp. SR21 TaxID=2919501 RepID=UPI001FA9D0B6|nr:SpoIIE family protein phosphatase [Nocardioides sp. SR21]